MSAYRGWATGVIIRWLAGNGDEDGAKQAMQYLRQHEAVMPERVREDVYSGRGRSGGGSGRHTDMPIAGASVDGRG